MTDCTIYVVTHKPYPVYEDGLYRKLCVGGYRDMVALSEQDGWNIAEYNDRLNEITGLYWMWKNTEEPYVGLNHYRRFFRQKDRPERIGIKQIDEIFSRGYDMILPEPVQITWARNIYGNISGSVGEKLAGDGYETVLREMLKKQPEYAEAYNRAMTERWMYPCNMFVARRDVMDRYCEWLFSFIVDAAEKLDVSGCTEKQRRTAGYFAETMMSVWTKKQKDKVYLMPTMMC